MASKRPVVANLDFDSIKQDMIEYFQNREEFADYNFTGSGLNMLMDVLAYNTHYNALTANFLMNEMFLDTALMRNNVASIAKMLNYQPRSARASYTTVTLSVPRADAESNFYVIPAGSVFNARSGNESFNFFNIQDYTVQFGSDVGASSSVNIDVDIYEGAFFTQRFVNNGLNEFPEFSLLNENVDTTTLTVSVNGEKFEQLTPEQEGLNTASSTSKVFWVEETRDNSHKIVFGNGVIGKSLAVGDEIVATYLVTNGADANGISNFSVTIAGRSDIRISGTPSASGGGSAPEGVREIKRNAPHWYQSQYRAVTEKDYEAITRKKFGDIQAINVFGGEKVNRPGKVFIAIKPNTSDSLSDAVKQKLVNEFLSESNVVTVTPEIVDPLFVDIILKTVVVYDNSLLVTNDSVLKTKVLQLFTNFNTQYIGDFLSTFRMSSLTSEINDLDSAIVSSNSRISLRASVTSTNQSLNRNNFSFFNKIYHPEDGYKSSTGGVLSSNYFTRVGRTFQSAFDEDGNGNIRLFDLIDGVKVFVNNFAGTINYETGEINITIDLDAEDGVIEFTVVPDSFDVISDNDTILRIATAASQVEVVEKDQTAILKNLNLSRSS